MPPITISVREAAEYIGVGKSKLYELISTHRLKVVRLGRRTLVRVDSINALLDGEVA